MPLLHYPKQRPVARLALGLVIAMAGRALYADAGQPGMLVPEARGIHEQTASMEQEQSGGWRNRRRTVKTRENPPLLVETPVPEPYPSEPMPQPQEQSQPEPAESDGGERSAPSPAPVPAPAPAPAQSPKVTVGEIPSFALPAEIVEEYEEYEPKHESMPMPTPEGVEKYRLKLENRLLERYNNLPEYAGRVARVRVVLSRPLDISMDGRLIKAEFDQLAYDSWGKRMPALEKEYYVVTFGSGGVQQVRSNPSIRVGLNMEKAWSEKAPPVADPFRNIESQEAFRPAPRTKMPSWWRPEFPELD